MDGIINLDILQHTKAVTKQIMNLFTAVIIFEISINTDFSIKKYIVFNMWCGCLNSSNAYLIILVLKKYYHNFKKKSYILIQVLHFSLCYYTYVMYIGWKSVYIFEYEIVRNNIWPLRVLKVSQGQFRV